MTSMTSLKLSESLWHKQTISTCTLLKATAGLQHAICRCQTLAHKKRCNISCKAQA